MDRILKHYCVMSRKTKYLNLVPKMPYLGIFGLEFENSIDTFEMSKIIFFQLQSLVKKTKMPKFGTKNTLFRYFGARTLKIIIIFEITTLKFV